MDLTEKQKRGILVLIFSKKIFKNLSHSNMIRELAFLKLIKEKGSYDSAEQYFLNHYRKIYYKEYPRKFNKNLT